MPKQQTTPLSAEEWEELRTMQQLVIMVQFVAGWIKGNTALVPFGVGQKAAGVAEAIARGLAEYRVNFVSAKLSEHGFAGQRTRLDLKAEKIIIMP